MFSSHFLSYLSNDWLDHVQVRDFVENKVPGETEIKNDPGVYVGVEDDDNHQTDTEEDDGLGDIWNEMSMALESNKVSLIYILYYVIMSLCSVCVYILWSSKVERHVCLAYSWCRLCQLSLL